MCKASRQAASRLTEPPLENATVRNDRQPLPAPELRALACILAVVAPLAGAASLSAATILHAQDAAKDAAKDATKEEAKDDILRGPAVPKEDVESSRGFTGGQRAKPAEGMQEADGKKDARARTAGSRADIEHRAFVDAVGRLALEGDRAKTAEAAIADFAARLESWRELAKAKQEEMLRLRRSAPSDQPPSEEFKRVASSIEKSRPKLAELEQQVYAMLDEAEGAALKEHHDAARKEIRAAMAREAEAKRAAAKEEMDRKRRAREAGEGKPSGKPAMNPE
jgi:hypothetical protein